MTEPQTMQLTFQSWLTEEIGNADRTCEHLKRIFGTFEFEQDNTLGQVEGYFRALRRVMHELDTREK